MDHVVIKIGLGKLTEYLPERLVGKMIFLLDFGAGLVSGRIRRNSSNQYLVGKHFCTSRTFSHRESSHFPKKNGGAFKMKMA